MYWMKLPPVHPDRARVFRCDALPGIEALHATFVEYRYALHTHESHTIALVDRGAAAFDLEGKRYRAPTGSVFFIPAGWAHTGESASPAGYSYRVLYVSPAVIVNDLALPPRRARSLDVVRSASHLARRLSGFHDRLSGANQDLETEEFGWSALARVASELVLHADLPAAPEVNHAAVRRAAMYLQEHWNQRVTLVELAAQARMSPYRLVRMFHQATGLPPSTYQRQLRIDQARRDLRRGLSPAEVALSCGFNDQAHLTRHIHRMTGVTPLAYARA
jgi:AraC-like DNA-binding protein